MQTTDCAMIRVEKWRDSRRRMGIVQTNMRRMVVVTVIIIFCLGQSIWTMMSFRQTAMSSILAVRNAFFSATSVILPTSSSKIATRSRSSDGSHHPPRQEYHTWNAGEEDLQQPSPVSLIDNILSYLNTTTYDYGGPCDHDDRASNENETGTSNDSCKKEKPTKYWDEMFGPRSILRRIARAYQPFPIFLVSSLNELDNSTTRQTTESRKRKRTVSLWLSRRISDDTSMPNGSGSGPRFERMTRYIHRALRQYIYQDGHYHSNRTDTDTDSNIVMKDFPSLRRALRLFDNNDIDSDDGQTIVVPLYVDWGDYIGCNCPNITSVQGQYHLHASDVDKHLVGLPTLTVAKEVSCQCAFPIPTYLTYEVMEMGRPTITATVLSSSQSESSSSSSSSTNSWWTGRFDEWDELYNWTSKIAKVYWRGSLSGNRSAFFEQLERDIVIYSNDNNSGHDSGNVTVNNSTNTITSSVQYEKYGHPFLDVKPAQHRSDRQPPETSMQYKAVMDMDGNSWSERFPRLLCYNSAVIRVINEPYDMEEYFMKDLVPYVHFIPASFRNITTVATYWMHPDRDHELLAIRNNARKFCQRRFVEHELNYDLLSVIDGYIETLYGNDPTWLTKWSSLQHLYVGPDDYVFEQHGGFWDGINRSNVRHDLLRPVIF